MRRYWHPVAVASDLDNDPVRPVTLLGESLVLYRDRKGRHGLIDDRCPHRRISLLYGIPEEQGLRCAYHGWMFDETGQCVEMPAEAPDSSFPSRGQDYRLSGPGTGWAAVRLPGPRTRAVAPSLGPVGHGQRGPGRWRNRDTVQLVTVHGELPGPGPHRVASWPLLQLRDAAEKPEG